LIHRKQKVDQNCYIDVLKTSLLPECRRLYPRIDFEFLQGWKTVFSKVTQQFLRQRTANFIAADEWACSLVDFNHYCILDILQDLVYEGRRLPCANLHWDSSKSIAQWKTTECG